MRKLLPLYIILLVFGYLCLSPVKAQDNLQISVSQVVEIHSEAEISISYKVVVDNQSQENLISSIDLFVPFEDYKISYVSGAYYKQLGKKISIDFGNNPIDLKQQKTILIKGKTTRSLLQQTGEKVLYMHNFGTSGLVKSFTSTVVYPQAWGAPTYISRKVEQSGIGSLSTETNKDFYVVWGDSANLAYYFRYKVESATKNFIVPALASNCNQRASIDNYHNITEFVADSSQNVYGVSTTGQEIELDGRIDLNYLQSLCSDYSPFESVESYDYDFPEAEGSTSREKIEFVANYLKNSFKITQYRALEESIQSMSGDRINLSLIAFLWLREEGIPSNLHLGWNYSQIGYSNKLVSWLSWYEDKQSTWRMLDIENYLADKTDIIDMIDVQRIRLYNLNKLSNRNLSIIESISNNSFNPIINVNQSGQIAEEGEAEVELKWKKEGRDFNKIIGKISVLNNSNQLFVLKDIQVNGKSTYYKDGIYSPVILPGESREIEFDYHQTLGEILNRKSSVSLILNYRLGSKNLQYSEASTVAPVSLLWGVVLLISLIVLTFTIYFLLNLRFTAKLFGLTNLALTRLASFVRVKYNKLIR